jgi:hypothetical protein
MTFTFYRKRPEYILVSEDFEVDLNDYEKIQLISCPIHNLNDSGCPDWQTLKCCYNCFFGDWRDKDGKSINLIR